MKKYERKLVKKVYKLLKEDITKFNFGYINMFDLSLFENEFEHRTISSKKGEIKINFVEGYIDSPIYVKLKGKYKKKIVSIIDEYYHIKRAEFVTKKVKEFKNGKKNKIEIV